MSRSELKRLERMEARRTVALELQTEVKRLEEEIQSTNDVFDKVTTTLTERLNDLESKLAQATTRLVTLETSLTRPRTLWERVNFVINGRLS